MLSLQPTHQRQRPASSALAAEGVHCHPLPARGRYSPVGSPRPGVTEGSRAAIMEFWSQRKTREPLVGHKQALRESFSARKA